MNTFIRSTMTIKPSPTSLVAALAACTVLVLSLGGIVKAANDKLLHRPPPKPRSRST